MAKLSISIVTYNNADIIMRTLSILLEEVKGLDCTLYIIDNASDDNTVTLIQKSFPDIIIIKNKQNIGFGAAHNIAINLCDSDYHIIMNPDISVKPYCINRLINFMDANNEVAAARPKILNSDETLQELPLITPKFKYLFARRFENKFRFCRNLANEYTMANNTFDGIKNIEFCSGCFMFCRTKVLKALGGFDERYFMYFEDADLSRMILRYGKINIVHDSIVIHDCERGSYKNFKLFTIHIKSMIKYFYKWNLKGYTQ